MLGEPRQHRAQPLAGVTSRSTRATSSGRPIATTSPPRSPASGPEIDHPVGELDDVEVVLDQHERVPGIDEPVEHLRELADVVEVQAGGRLVHHVELLSALLAREHELARDLEPLRLAAGQRRRRLAESQVAESDLLQLPERLAELFLARERSGWPRRR